MGCVVNGEAGEADYKGNVYIDYRWDGIKSEHASPQYWFPSYRTSTT
jgi:hypothetical protein